VRKAHFCSFFFSQKKNILPKSSKLNRNTSEINIRKTYNTRFDASSSGLSNVENRSSVSCFYQKLLKKYSFAFFEISISITVTGVNKTDLIEILLLLF
jgi:hypothetical protein